MEIFRSIGEQNRIIYPGANDFLCFQQTLLKFNIFHHLKLQNKQQHLSRGYASPTTKKKNSFWIQFLRPIIFRVQSFKTPPSSPPRFHFCLAFAWRNKKSRKEISHIEIILSHSETINSDPLWFLYQKFLQFFSYFPKHVFPLCLLTSYKMVWICFLG